MSLAQSWWNQSCGSCQALPLSTMSSPGFRLPLSKSPVGLPGCQFTDVFFLALLHLRFLKGWCLVLLCFTCEASEWTSSGIHPCQSFSSFRSCLLDIFEGLANGCCAGIPAYRHTGTAHERISISCYGHGPAIWGCVQRGQPLSFGRPMTLLECHSLKQNFGLVKSTVWLCSEICLNLNWWSPEFFGICR